MRSVAFLPLIVGALLAACTSTTVTPGNEAGPPGGEAGAASCSSTAALSGASYDITKSRFAFGSKPTEQNVPNLVRWVGSDGVVGISSSGSEMGVMNAGAPETKLPDWSKDFSKLTTHVTAYYASMGVPNCQISSISATYGSSGTTPRLERGLDGIPVAESHAYARFEVDDQTTEEGFYWPEIPAGVVTAAVAFKSKLADPKALAAYKAKLPSDAQGPGKVVIHHTSALSLSPSPFKAEGTYDVIQTTPQDDGGPLSFDENGKAVTTVW
jgi:hypothetical protein